MKKNWFVVVQSATGHEENNLISEADFYGPFDESDAECLACELNSIFEEETEEDGEGLEATAFPFQKTTAKAVLKKYQPVKK